MFDATDKEVSSADPHPNFKATVLRSQQEAPLAAGLVVR